MKGKEGSILNKINRKKKEEKENKNQIAFPQKT